MGSTKWVLLTSKSRNSPNVQLLNTINLIPRVTSEQAVLLNFTETDGMLGIRKRAERDLEGFEAPRWE